MFADMARALDPSLIGADVGLTLDPWQANVLRETPRRVLLLCSRQSGKSTVAALSGLSTALHQASSLTLIVSPSQRQSAEMFRRVLGYYRSLNGVPELVAESTLKAEFANGARVVALPGTERTLRGYSAADLVIIDEAARVDDELIAGVRPMLATVDGRLIALTTPAGRRGWFHDAWHSTSEAWMRVRVPASECPRISQAFLDEELRELGPTRFGAEYLLEFHDDDAAAFPGEVIAAAFTTEVAPLWV